MVNGGDHRSPSISINSFPHRVDFNKKSHSRKSGFGEVLKNESDRYWLRLGST